MNDKIHYVYKHLTIDTREIFYIGKGKERRAFEKSNSRNKLWKNIVKKHGYIVEFIKENLTEEESLILEKEEIEKHKPRANLSTGGRGGATGYKHTEESLKRRSATQSILKSTPEERLKNSIIQKEVQSRPEVKAKVKLGVAIFWRKVKNGEIPHPLLGKIVTESTRKKLSESQKGEKGYWYGKTTTVAKRVTNLNTGQIFESLRKATESVGGKNFRSLSRRIKAGKPYKKNLFIFGTENKNE